MKKTSINLIINREDYKKYENYFVYLKIVLTIFTIFFFILFIILFTIIKTKSDKESNLLLQKESLINILKDKTSDEVKINYIEKKYQSLNTYLKDDAFSSPYYALLSSALQESSEAAKLKTFEINKDRDVVFTIAFTDFSELMSFFRFIESKIFLENFETISLRSFSVIGATELQQENYELSFNGRFVSLNRDYFQKEILEIESKNETQN